MRTNLLIGAKLVGGDGAVEKILDAATGAQIAAVSEASAAQADAAAAGPREGGPILVATGPKERASALLKIAQHIEDKGVRWLRYKAVFGRHYSRGGGDDVFAGGRIRAERFVR